MKFKRRSLRFWASPETTTSARISPPLEAQLEGSPTDLEENPTGGDNLWLKAEEILKKDEKKGKILQASLEILESEYGSSLRPSGTPEREEQLAELWRRKIADLERRKWTVKLGDHSVSVQEQLTQICRNMLVFKDVVNAGAGTSPSAVGASGVVVVLSLIVQAADQHTGLLKGLESMSGLMCRLRVMEDLYRSNKRFSHYGPNFASLDEEFDDNLTSLYAAILEFQARALCYLRKHRVTQIFSSMFKSDGWDDLLEECKTREEVSHKFNNLINATEVRARFQTLQNTLQTHQVWQTTSYHDDRVCKFLRMLYTCPYRDRKERNATRVPGTCEWFTGHPVFQDWDASQDCGPLWVSADPGCGKSVLSRYLIDDVLPTTRTRSVCYFFFKDDFSDQRSAVNALCAVLRQLFIDQPQLLDESILDMVDIDQGRYIESFHDLWGTLSQAAANPNADEILCVFDALDECQEDDRNRLIKAVRSLYIDGGRRHKLKVLMTSRPYGHIRECFQTMDGRLPTIHLSGEDELEVEKISREIGLVIKKRVVDISQQKDLQPDERTFLQAQLTLVPNRTYLWVVLTLDVIENLPGFTRGNVRQAIRHVPRTVDDAYERILNRSRDRAKARRLLHIVIAATCPLSIHQMAVALAIEPHHRSYQEVQEEIEPAERFRRTLRDLCGLFVVVTDGKIYLLHQTAREFLVQRDKPWSVGLPGDHWKHSFHPRESNRILVERCIWRLLFKTPGPFVNYAADNWWSHVRSAHVHPDDPISTLAMRLCDPASADFKFWSAAYGFSEVFYSPTALSVACYFGLLPVVNRLLGAGAEDINYQGFNEMSPLSLAARCGYDDIVKLLLDTGGAVVNIKDAYRRTPLIWAANNGKDAVVRVLIRTGKVDLNLEPDTLETPLSLAAKNGHDRVVRLLLDTGRVNINLRDETDMTALALAAIHGNEGVVKLLLETGRVDVNSQDDDGETALSLAAMHGRDTVVKCLLDRGGVNVNLRNYDGRTALSWAAMEGHEEVVRLLLDTGLVDINSKDRNGLSPLELAEERSQRDIVEILKTAWSFI